MATPKPLRPKKKRQPRHSLDQTDNEAATPAPESSTPKLAAYPSKQLFVLACCRFSEPVAMTSSFPYLFFMIRDFHVSDDEKEIGRYAGFLASCFSFAQFFTGMCNLKRLTLGLPWGQLSDSWGRKPIVLCGLLGTVFATLVFGFSTSYTQALLARSAAGLLNGNVGVIRTMVAEMVVERSHQAAAFSVMPVVWSAGSILGPLLGGAYFHLCTN
jgi:MFS family permease